MHGQTYSKSLTAFITNVFLRELSEESPKPAGRASQNGKYLLRLHVPLVASNTMYTQSTARNMNNVKFSRIVSANIISWFND